MKNQPVDQTLTTFLGISIDQLNRLPAEKIEGFATQINSVFEQDKQFTPTFVLDGVKYGFIPKLDDITYGENKDLTTYLNDFKDMHKAMAVMYRPIKQEQRGKYLIEDYEGSAKYSEQMKEAPLSVVLGATVFFLQFNERIAESYPELFGGGVGEGVKGFAKKWGSYEESVALSDEKLQRIIGVELGNSCITLSITRLLLVPCLPKRQDRVRE